MEMQEVYSRLRKILIGYCLFLILYQCWGLVKYGIYTEIVFDSSVKTIIALLAIALLMVRQKWMWVIGILYLCLGTYDLLYRDFLFQYPRKKSSNPAYFDFLEPFYNIEIFYNSGLMKYIDLICKIGATFIFPLLLVLFFTKPIRRFYGFGVK